MKIVLILMPWCRRESPSPELAMSASILRKNMHEVVVFDINNGIFGDNFLLRKYWKYFLLDAPQETKNEFFDSTKEVFDYYAGKILSTEPDVIIFKITGKTFSNSEHMAGVIKKKDKKRAIIFSGALVPSQEDIRAFLNAQDSLPFDYIICGEDEASLPELVNCIGSNSSLSLKHSGKVIDSTCAPIEEDLDTLPFYDFSDYDLDSYRFPDKLEIFISRGCPWHCSFCVDWLTEKKYRSMSAERIYREVCFQAKKNRTRHFRFCDKTINGDIKAIEGFCDLALAGYDNGFPRIGWSGDAMIRPEMTKELISKMSSAGCGGIGYGLESGSEKVLKDMGKQFSIPLAEEVIRNTHLANIFTSINILVGFPTEANDDFQKTVGFVEQNKEFIDEIRLTFVGCRIYKHSMLYMRPENFNLLDTNTDFWSSKDGSNNYEERVRRYELISQRILDLGIDLRVNSRTTKKVVKA